MFNCYLVCGYLTDSIKRPQASDTHLHMQSKPSYSLPGQQSIQSLMDGYRGLPHSIRNDHHPVWNEFEKELLIFRPQVVGFSMKSPVVSVAVKLSAICKKILPDVVVIWGNTHTTVRALKILEDASVDFVVRGKGERTMVKLLATIENERTMDTIAGLSWKLAGVILQNPHRDLIEDIDSLPFPSGPLMQSAKGKMPVINV